MAYFFWCTGRALQVLALIQSGAALWIGMTTSDPRIELKMLGLSVIEFLIGYGITAKTGRRA